MCGAAPCHDNSRAARASNACVERATIAAQPILAKRNRAPANMRPYDNG
jgi:hypothetical protein